MPVVRYQIRNEYGLADPALYGAADKEDPEALLEGVAMAGMVGVLRQLGDLAEFAAEIFHDLHEEMMSTSSRGHGLLLRVQQLEAEFPAIEKGLFNQNEESEFNHDAGVDWHPNLQIDHNVVTREDMPRFILDCYEESRGPPRLFMLDKFDGAEDGACLKRYSDPSFFRTNLASTRNVEADFYSERRPRKNKKKLRRWKDNITPEVQNLLLVDNKLEHLAGEKGPENYQVKRVKLKTRHSNDDVKIGRIYMDSILGPESTEAADLWKNSAGEFQERTEPIDMIESSPKVCEIIMDGSNGRLDFKERSLPKFPLKEVEIPFAMQKRDSHTLSSGTKMLEKENGEMENLLPALPDQASKSALLVKDCYKKEASGSTETKSSSSLNDYRTDDVASELENYLDALATMESEIETDNEAKTKLDQNTFMNQYPKFNSKEEQTHITEPKDYSGNDTSPNREISSQADERMAYNFAESLASSEDPPITFTDHDLGDDQSNETDSVYELTMSKVLKESHDLVHDQMMESSCSGLTDSANFAHTVLVASEEENKSVDAFQNALSNVIRSDEINGMCSVREIDPLIDSKIQQSEMNVISSVLVEEHEQNDKPVEDDPLPRSPEPNIPSVVEEKRLDSVTHQSDACLQIHEDPQETLNADPRIDMSNAVECTPSSLVGDKASLLDFLSIENQEGQLVAISQEPIADFGEGAPSMFFPADDRSSTGSTEGLFESKESSVSSSDKFEQARSSPCSETAGNSSENDDTCAESLATFTRNEAMESGIMTRESFVSNHTKITTNGFVSESSKKQKASDSAASEEQYFMVNGSTRVETSGCIIESSSGSNSGDHDLVCPVGPFRLDEDNSSPIDGDKSAVSSTEGGMAFNPFLQSESESTLSDAQSPTDASDSKVLMGADNQRLSETYVRRQETDDAVGNLRDSRPAEPIHEPIDQTDNMLLINVSVNDFMSTKEIQQQNNDVVAYSRDSRSVELIHEPIDHTENELLINVSPHDVLPTKEIQQQTEDAVGNARNSKSAEPIIKPIDCLDMKLLTNVSPHYFISTMDIQQQTDDAVGNSRDSRPAEPIHEPIDQTDKKLLINDSVRDFMSTKEIQQHNNDAVGDSRNSISAELIHEPIDQMDKKLLINVSPHDFVSTKEIQLHTENAIGYSRDSRPVEPIHGPIDQTDKNLLINVSPHYLMPTKETQKQTDDVIGDSRNSRTAEPFHEPSGWTGEKLLTHVSGLDCVSTEEIQHQTVNAVGDSIYSRPVELIHEPIDRTDKKLLTNVSPQGPNTDERLIRSHETASNESADDDENRAQHSEINEVNSSPSARECAPALSEALPACEPETNAAFLVKEVSTFQSVDEISKTGGEKSHKGDSGIMIPFPESSNPKFFLPPDNKLIQLEPSELLPLDEDPPPPPLPPIQWRMGKLRPNSIPSMREMKSTLSPSSTGGPQLQSSNLSHGLQNIEVHQKVLNNETYDSDASYLQLLPITSVGESISQSKPSNPFFSSASKDRIIEGYFSDTTLATEPALQSLVTYPGFHMYASEEEPFPGQEYQKTIRRPSSLLNRPRDPLIEAVASHDKSTLRRVSELVRTSPKSDEERNNTLLEQIRSKSFNLRPAAIANPIRKAPLTNLKVAAILEKANAIRQAVAGSDEDDDGDSWSDS